MYFLFVYQIRTLFKFDYSTAINPAYKYHNPL